MTEFGPGRSLCDERYVIERLVGAGGMAAVWKARDSRLGRDVAIKVISDTLAADRTYLRRFRREARIAAGLSHPNLVRIYDFDAEGSRPFLVMEYVSGGTLADRLRSGDLTGVDPDRFARDVLIALAEIHDAGIVHRDVKPANVLIDRDGRARVTDFGIAHSGETTSLTRTGVVVGTHRYLAPEILQGASASPLTDLYSAGVMFEEIVSRLPSPGLATLATHLAREDPSARPQSAGAALEILKRGGPGTRDIATAPTEPMETGVQTGTLAVLAALAVLLVVIVLSFAAGGDDGDAPSGVGPQPAPARQEPLSDRRLSRRLDALEEAIRAAGR